MGMFIEEKRGLHQAGQGLRRAAWPEGTFLRCVEGDDGIGYEKVEMRDGEQVSSEWWVPTQADLIAADWYLDDAWSA